MKNRSKTIMSCGIGILYLGIGVLFLLMGFLLADSPGISSAVAPRYDIPHACAGLECRHGYLSGPNGRLFCAKYPPKEVLDARLTPSVKRARLTAGATCGILGGGFAILTFLYGLLRLLRRAISTERVTWSILLCRIAPFLTLCCWIAACVLKAIYPVTPL